jgi:hypothetical protein
MTPRERFFAALAGEMPDKLALTIWNNKLPGGEINETLLDMEVCVINKSTVWQTTYQGVDISIREEVLDGEEVMRYTDYHTPKGRLHMVERVLPHTTWIEKFPFSGAEDYDAMAYLFTHRNYIPDHDTFLADDKQFDGASLARPKSIHTPMHELIYEYMGIETFCVQYAEHFDQLIDLNSVLEEDCMRRVQLVAESPACYAVIDGNTQIDLIGLPRFETYYLPYIEKACTVLHAHNTYAGSHLDGNNKKLAPVIAQTDLDFIEAFTPPPDCDLPLREARKIWNNKSILVNFPSSVHLYGISGIEQHCREILEQAAPGAGFSIGVTEDVPERGVHTLIPLFSFLRRHGDLPLKPMV